MSSQSTVTDGQTDGRTDGRTTYHENTALRYASRGLKKVSVLEHLNFGNFWPSRQLRPKFGILSLTPANFSASAEYQSRVWPISTRKQYDELPAKRSVYRTLKGSGLLYAYCAAVNCQGETVNILTCHNVVLVVLL